MLYVVLQHSCVCNPEIQVEGGLQWPLQWVSPEMKGHAQTLESVLPISSANAHVETSLSD